MVDLMVLFGVWAAPIVFVTLVVLITIGFFKGLLGAEKNKKILLLVVLLLAAFIYCRKASADTYIVYDGKTGSEKTIALRKSVAEDMAKQFRSATGEVADTLRAQSKESDIIFILNDECTMRYFDLGKGKKQFIEWFGADKNAAKFIKVY